MFAILEATVFPAPTEAVLIMMALARPSRAWLFAGIATVASVTGAIMGYALAVWYFPSLIEPVLESFGLARSIELVQRVYRDNYIVALVTSGYTPLPYMLYTAIAGTSGLPLAGFIGGSLVGRALKYFPIAGLAMVMGPSIHRFLKRFGGMPMAAVIAVAASLYLILR